MNMNNSHIEQQLRLIYTLFKQILDLEDSTPLTVIKDLIRVCLLELLILQLNQPQPESLDIMQVGKEA